MTRNGPMTTQAQRIDEAAFGVVYGSITVMALLMAMTPPLEEPGRKALILFGSVFAVALAKAYAERSITASTRRALRQRKRLMKRRWCHCSKPLIGWKTAFRRPNAI